MATAEPSGKTAPAVPTDFDLDAARDRLLAALLDSDWRTAAGCSRAIAAAVEGTADPTEGRQKALAQIRQVLRLFGPRVPPPARPAITSAARRIRRAAGALVRRQVRRVRYVDYDRWRRRLGLSDRRLAVFLRTVNNVQLTVGCSGYCRRCNEWALPAPRAHFTFDAVRRLTGELIAAGNLDFALYGASDPLDWRHGRHRMDDILAVLAQRGHRPRFGLLTKVPPGSEPVFEQLVRSGADLAVSLCERNRERVAAAEARVGRRAGVHHDVDELLIPACRDEDFSSVRSSITDSYGGEITPEGASMVVPAFTSALNPTGQCRLPVGAGSDRFLGRRVGRRALPVEYFKPLAVLDIHGRERRLEALLDVQVENVLLDGGMPEATPPGMTGMNDYLERFSPAAAARRSKMASVVLVRLARESLPGDPRGFRRRATAYLDSCRPEPCVEQLRRAMAWQLSAAADYLRRRPQRRRIVDHLLAAERALRGTGKTGGGLPGPGSAAGDFSPFDWFRRAVLNLVADPGDPDVSAFVRRHAARYDPQTDDFRSAG